MRWHYHHARFRPAAQSSACRTDCRATRRRLGLAQKPLLLMIASLLLLGGLVFSLSRPLDGARTVQEREPLVVYCAASNKSVMEAVRKDYEQEFGVPLQIQYGPSQTLLAAIQVAGAGDLFLPADDSYLTMARGENLLADEYPLATMQAVIAVAKGNPKGIAKLDDLLRDDVKVAQGSPEGTAIGKLTKESLTSSGHWEKLHGHTTVYKTTVNEVASDVKVQSIDAGIVFDAVLHDFPTLEAIGIPELEPVNARITVATLRGARQPRQAAHFARYMSSRDAGLKRYQEFGFKAVDGDPWEEVPEVTLYAGSMLRPAIEETITAFEEREGVRVTRVYNGCGILVAQMKSGDVPDAYFACDTEFMNQVKPFFPAPADVSQNELVILVQEGNPHKIASLADLTKPNLRVGIGHEKQCAMGWLTQRTFDESGMKTELMKNVVVQTPTGDMLVNQMRSGSLDAAVAYLSNAAGSGDFLDAVRIQGIPCSVATQPYAVAKDSKHKQIAQRLLAAIRAESSQQRFASEGFRWIEDEQPTP